MAEVLVSLSLRFPNDHLAVAAVVAPVVEAAIAAGSELTSVTVQSLDEEEDDG